MLDKGLYDTDYDWRVEADKGGNLNVVADLGSHWIDLVEFMTGLQIDSVLADLATMIPIRKKRKRAAQSVHDRAAQTLEEKEMEKSVNYERIRVDTEDQAAVLLRFADSPAQGVMTISQVSAGRKFGIFFEISGAKNALAWDGERANELWIGHRDKPNEILVKDPALLEETAQKLLRYPGGVAGEGFIDSHTQCMRVIYEYIRDKNYKKDIKPEFPTFEDGHRDHVLYEAILKSVANKEWAKTI